MGGAQRVPTGILLTRSPWAGEQRACSPSGPEGDATSVGFGVVAEVGSAEACGGLTGPTG